MVRGERKKSGGRGKERGGHEGIDHVTAPAITSNMSVCFYCTVMPNKVVLCKKSQEKQHTLNERVRRGIE